PSSLPRIEQQSATNRQAAIEKVFVGLWGFNLEKTTLEPRASQPRRNSNAEGGRMTKRGKILRDATTGPGLLSVDGQHHQFPLDGVWRSPVPPTVGMAVDVEFAADTSILGIIQVSESKITKNRTK